MAGRTRCRLSLSVVLALAALSAAAPASGQTLRLRGVWTGAAVRSAGATMVVRGSLAQAVMERLEGPTLVVQSGFWSVATGTLTGVAGDLPSAFALGRNYPNPFNPRTTIPFALPRDSQVRLAVFDLRGRLVTVLVDGDLPAGSHAVVFSGDRQASGLYLYRIDADGWASTGRMMLLK